MFHQVEIERYEILSAAKRTAGVTALHVVYHAYNVAAHLGAYFV